MDTWDAPLNTNFGLLDTIVGGITSISTTGGTTTLNAAQLACGTISVGGALTSSARLVFPSVQGWWTIKNQCSGTTLFNLEVASGAATEIISIPPGCLIDIQVNGAVVEFRNLPMVGSYMDISGTALPLWINGCSKPPYLVCDGSPFSSGTYPFLTVILGGTTLPDFRGRSPYYLNQSTGRLTLAGAGIDGDTRFVGGGANGITLAANQIPSLTSVNASQAISVTSSDTVPKNYSTNTVGTPGTGTPVAFPTGNNLGVLTSIANNSISVTYTNASLQGIANAAPGMVGGIRLIRAG